MISHSKRFIFIHVPKSGGTSVAWALRKYGLRRGVASLCIGGGEATAMALELV